MISRLESATTVSRYWPAKNTKAVSMMANISARNGAATSANSTAAAPSSRQSSRRAAADPSSRSRREASPVQTALNMAELLRLDETVENFSKYAFSKYCPEAAVGDTPGDISLTIAATNHRLVASGDRGAAPQRCGCGACPPPIA